MKLAGNGILGTPLAGQVASSNSFASASWASARLLAINPLTNNIYIHGFTASGCHQPIFLNRSTGLWETFFSSCSTAYWLGDGLSATTSWYIGWSMLGFESDTKLVGSSSHWSGVHEYGMVKSFDVTTGVQSHFIGTQATQTASSLPPDGTDMTTGTQFPQHAWGQQIGFHWDAANSRWLASAASSTRIAAIPSIAGDAGAISTLTTTARSIRAFTYRLEGGNQIVYYCATDGRIYRRDVTSATEAAVAWPSSTISCAGKTMSINSNLNRLEFIFTQNGLFGVAEIQLDPP